MSKRRIRELEAMLSKHVTDYEINKQRSGHLCITIQHAGQSRKLFTSSTPSEKRGLKNLESDLKKIMRSMEGA